MDARDYLQQQFASVRRLTDAVMQATTDEQLKWTPPGTVNSIGTTFVHLLATEDRYVQDVLEGKPMLWEAQGWSEKIGLEGPPGRGRGWEDVRGAALALVPLLDYQRAIRAATDDYVSSLTPEELERQVDFMDGKAPVALVLARLVVHTAGHTGEIAALKGAQGVKGLPF